MSREVATLTSPREVQSESAAAVPPWRRRARPLAVTAWIVGAAAWTIAGPGLSTRAAGVLLLLGVVAMSVGTSLPWRFLRDWAPLVLLLLAYQRSRSAADTLGMPTQWTPHLEVDRWLGLGQVPTSWLQSHLLRPEGQIAWWERVTVLVYVSHFVVAIAVALVLWMRSRREYLRFVVRLAAVMAIGVGIYVLVPAAPPWAAGRCTAAEVAAHPSDPPCMHEVVPSEPAEVLIPIRGPDGQLEGARRLTTRGFGTGSTLAAPGRAVESGSRDQNLVAAVPSLHAAFSMLVVAFLWPRVRRRWRPLMATYPVAMAFTLVWAGDHYVIDILAGWGLALTVLFVGRRLERRRPRTTRRVSECPITTSSSSDRDPATRS